MKIKKLLFFAGLFFPFGLMAQFTIQDPGFPEYYEVSSVDAVSENVVWITAKDNSGNHLAPMFSVSETGGNTWNTGYITGDEGLAPAMIYGSALLPYAFAALYKTDQGSGSQVGIYASFNFGETWERQPGVFEDPTAFPDIVYFWDGGEGVAIGDPIDNVFDVYTTNNYGTTWLKVPSANIPEPLTGENAIVGTYAVSGGNIWFSTTKGRVFRSDNRGLNWTAYSSPFNSHTRIVFRDNMNGYLQDLQSWETTQLAQTSDGGATWQIIGFDGDLLNWDLDYIPGTTGTLVSSGAYLRNGLTVSCDYGQNWDRMIDFYKVFQMDWFDWQSGWLGAQIEVGPDVFRPVVYKYTGPGVGNFLISPLLLDFGNVNAGDAGVMQFFMTNNGTETIHVSSITNSTGEFSFDPPSCVVEPNGGQCMISVTFAPGSEGFFSDEINIECDHPDLPNWVVQVHGNGIIQAFEFSFDPESFNETMIPGENKIKNLSFTNNSENFYVWEIETEYLAPLQSLGWRYGSTPLDADDGILGEAPDQAMFIKDIHIRNAFDQAILRLGFDDGIRVWVNGNLVLDDKYANHFVGYWDQEIDITQWLDQGFNRISAVVFNGIFNGGGSGGFDCELEIDGQQLIKRGDQNYGLPEAMWFYYGNTHELLGPSNDINEIKWWEKKYGSYQWLSLNKSAGMASGDGFENLGWNYWSAPFGGNEFLLNESPDNAYFIKDFEIETHDEAILYLNYDDGCMVILNGGLLFDFSDENHGGEYWNKELNISENLIVGRNRLSIVVYNGVYGGGGTGSFDCHLLIDGINKISRGDFYSGEPEAFWHVYGQAGQVLTPPNDANGREWWEMDYALNVSPLPSLGWNYNSTPVFENPDLLSASPDNAQFIKDIDVGDYSEAYLYLGYDDGCRVWINGVLEFDFHDEVHNVNYWDKEVDLSGMLIAGTNRIAIGVYNGIYGGGAFGGFDCQLLVDGVEIIKRGDQNSGQPETMWFMFGEAGKVLIPPNDANGLDWFQKDYGTSALPPAGYLQGNIDAWQTDQVKVVFDATGLAPGDYSAIVRFNNAGTQEKFEIPVNLQMQHVIDETCMAITPSSLDFGEYFTGYPETLKLKIQNQGYNTLFVDEIYALHEGITITPNTFSIEPGKSIDVEVTAEFYDLGPFNSCLVIISNDDGQTEVFVPISADSKNAPSLVIENLEYMYSYLASGQSETQNLHISNWGGSPLIFTIPQAEGKDYKTGFAKKPVQNVQVSQPQLSIEVMRTEEPSYYQNDIIGHKNLVVNDKSRKSPKAFAAPQIDIFKDNMENGDDGWVIENYGEGKSQWHKVKFNSYSPETSWWCGDELTGTYINGYAVREAIISPEIKLPNVESVITLEFNESYEIEGMYDQGGVDISIDGGIEWLRIRENIPGYSGGWITTFLDISQFYGNIIKVRFFFDTGDDVANAFPGWFIDDVRIYVEGFNFLSMAPGEGSVNAGEGFDISVTFDASDYSDGYYPGFIMLKTNDPANKWFYLPAIMEVWGGNYFQNFNLPAGWSGISSYLIPENGNPEQLLSPISNELIILQNLSGVYWPQQDVNTIGDWNYLNGYTIKLNASATLDFAGTIPDNRLIEMPAGWSLIPVLSFNPVPATDFDPLESLNIIKEVAGTGVYWPVYNINTIQDLQPGKSYLISVSGDEVFEYPPMIKNYNFKASDKSEKLISPWNEITRTPATHIVALPSESRENLLAGDVIGIFNPKGYCAAFVEINNIAQGQSFVVFGDDPTTAVKEGFSDGEKMQFKLFRPSTNQTILLEATFDPSLPNQGYFATNGLSAISGLKEAAVNVAEPENTNMHVFPNPTNGILQIWSSAPLESLEVINQTGICVLKVYTKIEPSDQINISALPAGIYQIRLVTSGTTVVQKIIKH